MVACRFCKILGAIRPFLFRRFTIVESRLPISFVITMVTSIVSPNFHKMFYIIALLNGSFENNFIFTFTFLNQSNPYMKSAIIYSTTNLIFTDFIS